MTHAPVLAPTPLARTGRPPRLGFLGVGWIGRLRLESLVESRAGRVELIADPDP